MAGMCTYSAIVCLVAVLIITGIHHHEVFVFLNDEGFQDKLDHDIVIGVLSARENAVQRQAIRETWAGYIRNQSNLRRKLLVKFIIGSKGCEIPPEFREDPYSCTSVLATHAANLRKEIVAFDLMMTQDSRDSTANIDSDAGLISGYYGVDFNVNHALVVKRLGVYDTGSLEYQPIVTIYDTWRREAIMSVAFTPDNPGTLQDGFRYKDVEPVLFPKMFEGTIVAGPFNQHIRGIQVKEDEDHMQNHLRMLLLRSFHRTAKTATFPDEIGFPYHPVTAGNFIFEIHQPDDVKGLLNSWMTTEQLNREKNNKLSQALFDEQQEYGDLLLVNEVDVYRNLPKKLLHFFQWVISNTEVSLILKTDDDCFVNINAIMGILHDKNVTANSRSWWGSFRTNWQLDILGKWAEHEYPSPVYPAFACGSGSLLSRDLVQWMAQNSKYLHSYQGEDVSLGIWLASILPTYIHDRRWQCDKTCYQDIFVLPEQSPHELKSSWQKWVQCKNPCSCE